MFKGFFKPKEKHENMSNSEKNSSSFKKQKTEDKQNIRLDFFDRLKTGLDKTRREITGKIDSIFRIHTKLDDDLFEELEEVLITADIGVETTIKIMDGLKHRIKEERITNTGEIKTTLKEEIKQIMMDSNIAYDLNVEPSPAVILVIGVNGAGKTTTIGKLSYNLKNEGKTVLIAAGDTFRAAAIEQLGEWSRRSGAEFISHNEGSDPAAVIYDGIQAAKARGYDVLICDTAGRLHNKKNLMNELNKIFRIIDREYPEAAKEVLLVLDASTGQNAISQAKVFGEVCNITGVALTKLDGTAKGGVIIALQSELGLPVKLVGIGENIDDLHKFNPNDFIEAIFG